MEVAIHDPDRVSSSEENSPDLEEVNDTWSGLLETIWGLTELKRNKIKLGDTSELQPSKEFCCYQQGMITGLGETNLVAEVDEV